MEGINEEQRRQIRRLLWRWGRVTEFCARRHHDIEEFNELIESVADIRPQQLSGMPHGGGTSDPTQRAAFAMDGLKERYEARVSELAEDIQKELDFAKAIDGAVKVLDAAEMGIIELRYKKGKRYEQIAEDTRYSVDHVKRIEREAIDKLSEEIKIEIL